MNDYMPFDDEDDAPRTWYFTFGAAHRHPRTDAPLGNRYTTAYGRYDEARKRVYDIFGAKWAFQYKSAEAAGVDRFHLRPVACAEYEPGELLPPTQRELEKGRWPLMCTVLADAVALVTRPDKPVRTEPTAIHVPCDATLHELAWMFERYGIPKTARVGYGECGSHIVVVEWDVRGA